MSLLPQSEEAEPERFDGLSLLYWTIMGPYGINRVIHRVVFSDCENGLGIKIIGGFKEQTGEEYGIYVKRILETGIAASDGRLQAGDLILEVNGEDLAGVTNERAVDILRMASASSHMSLLIARDDEARKEFAELMEKCSSHSNAGSARSSPTPHTAGKHLESTSSTSSSSSLSPQLLSPKDIVANNSGVVTTTAPATTISNSPIQLISIPQGTSLGLNIMGGTNKPEGPMVCVQEVIPGGDCHKDGRLQPGDQLVSINKESLISVTHEEAKSILTRLKLRSEGTAEIAFVSRSSQPNSNSNLPNPSTLPASSPTGTGNVKKPSGFSFLSPPNSLHPMMASSLHPETDNVASARTNQGKSGCKKSDQSPVISPMDSSPDSACTVNVTPAWPQSPAARGRSLSLNHSFRLKVEKLEMALKYLGINPTEEQQQTLRQQLQVDCMGTVAYGDFVQAARDLFRLQLGEAGSEPGVTIFTSSEEANLCETTHTAQITSSSSVNKEDLERITRERNGALKELKRVKDGLAESEKSRKQLSEELQKVKQEAKSAVEECRALRSRIHLAEAAQRQAQGMEMDYEEVVRLLEAEITELKAQLVDQHGQTKDDTQDLRKRIAVLDCQLRKSEIAKKTFEVSTEKLLQFVEVVHEVLAESPAALTNVSAIGARRFSGPALPQNFLDRLGRGGPRTPASISTDARELAKSVRAIIEADCLPYGWEEAYTADGIKYFINHVTQMTSWIHPVTSALSLPCVERSSNADPQELPEFSS
ncbi:syntaxin-binding protein 4 isoform X1 [Carcharodon carcharias]|uniref:syntaxin-binding protein 4 isoform X1 n=1 Tax=Carcharodon carcharias TaxID=13397 RepID=UPI001B7DAAEF|nr:syntaxin-binding protein 4 isoform X1 [Carcharodon carcharias]